ncbi:hypothetical protein [Pseudobacteriovorax antillogorgiicola]|uniref:VWFA domain-containing protein n=1 Tax=Pseudobacteriovorax antillogorgiicola TaxID=1513793 RepID=A0A1Y6C283_9BACT|nr:hypothetical protein [Pseudobacteriovorax antillogorgiicola]TCS50240.1 hypothetical protein EDD56_11358 [Pseudobacteriovorax antillogorgiicola]SMF32798.1 hypothetical protein SAMN06296036_11057 [Pseudobacteriovorax antillogorgiicola]
MLKLILTVILSISLSSHAFGDDELCDHTKASSKNTGKLVMFIGVDISGSFKRLKDNALRFISRYMYAHLHGCGDIKKIRSLFVGSIGGAKPNEPKTFYPIESFKYKSIDGIEKELRKIFSKTSNQYTDYNAFFAQVATFMKNKKLVMKPTDIILLSDGIPDAPKVKGKADYRSLKLKPLENLSRKITVRVLYTSAVTGSQWQSSVPRNRVRVWTQDANVMKMWEAPDIFLKGKPFAKQDRFFNWLRQNVDWSVRKKTVK